VGQLHPVFKYIMANNAFKNHVLKYTRNFLYFNVFFNVEGRLKTEGITVGN
jgi:hypothetical protein